MSEKRSWPSPRSSALSSASLPRLRSQPIQTRSRAIPAARPVEQEERRMSRAAVLVVERLDSGAGPARAAARPPGSSACRRRGNRSAAPKHRFGSRLARNRTSSARAAPRRRAALREQRRHHDERAGIPAGMPCEKSMRGRSCGATSRVASQFTSASASWLPASSARTATSARRQPDSPSPCIMAIRAAPNASVISQDRGEVRGTAGTGRSSAARALRQRAGGTRTARSSCGTPASIR